MLRNSPKTHNEKIVKVVYCYIFNIFYIINAVHFDSDLHKWSVSCKWLNTISLLLFCSNVTPLIINLKPNHLWSSNFFHFVLFSSYFFFKKHIMCFRLPSLYILTNGENNTAVIVKDRVSGTTSHKYTYLLILAIFIK